MSWSSKALIVLVMAVLAGAVQAGTLGALTKAAIDASDGRASGVLDDAVAGMIAKSTGSDAPVAVRIETLRVFRQAGCRRLKVILSQPVPGQPDRLSPFEMNLCRDGSPPRDGMDLEQAAGRFGALQSMQ